jgi:hypothetical protein
MNAGYFYKGFDADTCVDKIKEAILTHDENIASYKKSAEEVLFKFSVDNEENIAGYRNLVENIS